MLASTVVVERARDFPLLTFLIVLPFVGAIATMLTPKHRPEWAKAVAFLVSATTLGMSLWMLAAFDKATHGYQFDVSHNWIGNLGVRFSLGIDGISLFMVVLTAVLFPIGLLASVNEPKFKEFATWMLMLQASVVGVFAALDLVVFFIFFELVLVPMYFLIAGWGHGNRAYAATKFFLYTMAGSAFLFVGILTVAYLYTKSGHALTFDVGNITEWISTDGAISTRTARLLFLAFAVSFAVKVPLFPLHTWLPDAHTEAPTAGSVVLAGVLLKMGTYGFLRFAIPMFPAAAHYFAPVLLTLSVVGIVYGAIVATMQPDLKRLIAYSSVAHLGFVVMGTFALTTPAILGGLFTMLSHGLTTGALFLLVGMLYDRRHTRLIADFGGLWKSIPVLSALFLVATFASIGLPGFSGFVGEFMSLLGTYVTRPWWAVVATSGVILAAVYLLWAFQRSFTGEPTGENVGLRDISLRELVCVGPLLGLSLFLGFYPQPVLDRMKVTVEDFMGHLENSTGYIEPESPNPEPVDVHNDSPNEEAASH